MVGDDVPSVALWEEGGHDGISGRIKIHKLAQRRRRERAKEEEGGGAGEFEAGVEATWTRENGGIM